MCAKFYELCKAGASRKFLIDAYKEFLESTTDKLDDEICLVSSISSTISEQSFNEDSIHSAIQNLPEDFASVIDTENSDIINNMGRSINGLIMFDNNSFVDPKTYAKIQGLYNLLDDFDITDINQIDSDDLQLLMNKMGLNLSISYPVSSTSGEAHSLTIQQIIDNFDSSKPFSLMDKLKESVVTNTALSSIFEMYQGEDVEAKQNLDIASFKDRVMAKMGSAPDDRLMGPSIQLLNTAIKCPNASTFLTIFNKMLNFNEDEGYSEDITPLNNDLSNYTGSAWAGFWGMAGPVATKIASAIATGGKCLFNVIGGVFLAINGAAFKILGYAVNAVTKFIKEIFDPVAIAIAKGNSASVEGFGIITNNHWTPLLGVNSNYQSPLWNAYFPANQVKIKTNARLKSFKGKWIYFESIGMKGLYKLEDYRTTTIDGVEYFSQVWISSMVKPIMYDIPAVQKLSNFLSAYATYNVFRIQTVPQSALDDLSAELSNSMVQKLETQASGFNFEQTAGFCLTYPFIVINSIAWHYISESVTFTTEEAADNFNSHIYWGKNSVYEGWGLGATCLPATVGWDAFRNNDGSSKNLSNSDFVKIATGAFGDAMYDRGALNNASLPGTFLFSLIDLAPWPICPFLALCKDIGNEPDGTFIPYTTMNIGDWGTEQITIKTDKDLATSSLLKVITLAAAITAVFVAPKIIGKIQAKNSLKLKNASDTIKSVKQKVDNGEHLSFLERLKYRRSLKRMNKFNGALSPAPTVSSISLNDSEQQDNIESSVEDISNRLW